MLDLIFVFLVGMSAGVITERWILPAIRDERARSKRKRF